MRGTGTGEGLSVLHEPARHEPLRPIAWEEARAFAMIERIARDAAVRFSRERNWPVHPLDAEGGAGFDLRPLYFGACGVIWALHYLQAAGAVTLPASYAARTEDLMSLTEERVAACPSTSAASYLMGETGMHLLGYWLEPRDHVAARLEALIASNIDNPARDLMWGSPGTLLAALFLYEHTGETRWAELFQTTALKLHSDLRWSPEYQCHYWVQELYGYASTYLDAVHGFVGNALPLVRGRHLLAAEQWREWQDIIINTVERTATREGPAANWRPWLYTPRGMRPPLLVQACHGAPGFVVCLADLPDRRIDELLIAGAEATWAAGPLVKGPTLCHGTAGNGYAFLKLYARTRVGKWLERARAFAMHAIAQTEAAAERYGQMRYSLWTGDLGVAIYLWDCIRGAPAFPTLDIFFASAPTAEGAPSPSGRVLSA
jgi:hypothetical protein